MKKWSVKGKVVVLSDDDYYNQWIGIVMLTDDLGGLLGGNLDLHDENGTVLEKHAEYLRENINLVENEFFLGLLSGFETQFMKVIALDHEVVATLSEVLGLGVPKKKQDFTLLYKKLTEQDHIINPNGFLSHPAFDELRSRFLKISATRSSIKEKIITYIIDMFPEAASSEYLCHKNC